MKTNGCMNKLILVNIDGLARLEHQYKQYPFWNELFRSFPIQQWVCVIWNIPIDNNYYQVIFEIVDNQIANNKYLESILPDDLSAEIGLFCDQLNERVYYKMQSYLGDICDYFIIVAHVERTYDKFICKPIPEYQSTILHG